MAVGDSGAFQVLAAYRRSPCQERALGGNGIGRQGWPPSAACLIPVGIGHSSLEQNLVLAAQMVAKLGTGRCLAMVALWDGTMALALQDS